MGFDYLNSNEHATIFIEIYSKNYPAIPKRPNAKSAHLFAEFFLKYATIMKWGKLNILITYFEFILQNKSAFPQINFQKNQLNLNFFLDFLSYYIKLDFNCFI